MTLRNRFQGQHVLVTGGAQGIGFEIVRQFLREGAYVTVIDRNENQLLQAVKYLKEFTHKLSTYTIDVRQREAVFNKIQLIESEKPVDILINNAGIASETPFLEISESEWQQIIDVNLTGMFHVSQVVSSQMVLRRQGVIVNMSSKNGLDGEKGYAHYNSSKAGVIMLTKTMALELAEYGIRVNAVCPGYIQTPMSMEIDSQEFTDQFVDRYIPMNRPGKVDEVASLFLFLASSESSFMTGQVVIVDGGQLAGQKPFS